MFYLKKIQNSLNNKALNSTRIMPIFGIFGIINYPIFHIVWSLISNSEFHNLNLRLIAATLCLGLVIKDYWPDKLKPLLPLYWYITVLYCLPFFYSYMFLLNHGSSVWLLNSILATFLLIMVVDWLSFSLLLTIGIIIGIVFYKLTIGPIMVQQDNLISTLVNIIWIILVCIFFSYSREAQEKENKQNLIQITELKNQLEDQVQERDL